MRNIFLFLRRHLNLLVFLLLEAFALSLLFRYNKFHNAAYMNTANEISGAFFKQFNKVEDYFYLKKENERLSKEVERLLNEQKTSFTNPDTSVRIVQDTIPFDSTGLKRRYRYYPAMVINNSVILPDNFITIFRGSDQGIKPQMAVVGPDGVVGTVVGASKNMSRVMSLLNKEHRVSAKLKKTKESGSIIWDGKSPEEVVLKDIPKSVRVAKGDTVVTTQYSDRFPPNIMVGTVSEIEADPSSNFYTLRVKTATSFGSLQHVFVIDNLFKDEQDKLESTGKKNSK